MDRLPQEEGGRRRLQRHDRAGRLRQGRQRRPRRLRRRQPGRQPRAGAVPLLRAPGRHARQRSAARPLPGAGDNHAHPTDGQYVENVMWQRDGILFATVNVPGGSDNDADPWYGAPNASPQQLTEAANRTGADLRWLDRAFSTAATTHARAVVVTTQADLWDLDGKDTSHLANYEPIVSS